MNSAYFSELDVVQCFIIGNHIFFSRLSGNSYPILLSYNNGSYPKAVISHENEINLLAQFRLRIALWINKIIDGI